MGLAWATASVTHPGWGTPVMETVVMTGVVTMTSSRIPPCWALTQPSQQPRELDAGSDLHSTNRGTEARSRRGRCPIHTAVKPRRRTLSPALFLFVFW